MTLETGAMLGRYRIESLVGRGGMGAVYLATDTQLDRRVALKVLSPELPDDKRFRDRFIAESRIAASLDDPNIVPVYEAGEIDGRLFIAMRYIDGQDLSDVLAKRGALPIALAVRIIASIAAALDAAHAKGLVHRDVKPGNVLLAGPDEAPLVYLTDFGLTKRIGDQSMTAAGQIVGSIGYVAPEQVEGRPVDARTDVYSLGCLAFEILTGTSPFVRDSEMAVLMAHVQDPPPSLLARRPELPEALDAAVARAMAKDPAARFDSAGDFARAALEAIRPDAGSITRGFLFADLRGYTAYVESHGDTAASALLLVYRRMMRDTIAKHGGAEIKTEGDSFYVVFPSASGAVMCGLSIAAAAAAQSHADPQNPIRVGIGVNAGEAVAAPEGYVGSAVNIAARVCALAKPGEVWVTDTVRGLTRTSGRLIFTSVGRHGLKGIAEPMALFRAEPAGSGLVAAPGGSGTFWRRPAVLAGMGGVVVLVLAVVAVKGGLGPLSASPSASRSESVAPSAPVGVAAERIAYTQVRSHDPLVFPSCGEMAEGRAYLLDPAGGDPVRITHGGDASETHLAWSPDGAKVAFVGFSSSGYMVYLMNLVTGEAKRLLPDPLPEGIDTFETIDSVSWSPDGNLLVFSGWQRQVWVVGVDGLGLHSLNFTLPSNSGSEGWIQSGAPVWLPDGRMAALLQNLDADYPSERLTTLATAPASGGELTPLSWMDSHLTLAGVGWSRDRTKVAFVGADVSKRAPDESLTWGLYIANADGSDIHQVAPAHGSDNETLNRTSDPAWSPDGKEIVFGSGMLYIVDAASGEVRELPGTPGRAACWPSWGRTTIFALPQPTPTLAPGATPVPAPFHEGLLDPGAYVTDVFRHRMRFEIGPGWEGSVNSLDQLALTFPDIPGSWFAVDNSQVVMNGSCLDSPTLSLGEDPGDLVAYLNEHPHLTASGGLPFNVAGLSKPGLSVEIEVSELPSDAECPPLGNGPPRINVPLFVVGQGWEAIRIGNRVRIIALRVEGELLAVWAEAPADRYDQFQAQVQPILDSLTFP